jgi:outer membrane protein assembly factor BamA
MGMSVGAGIRLNMPGVGPIRIDYALPLANSDSTFVQRFNFGVGQKF